MITYFLKKYEYPNADAFSFQKRVGENNLHFNARNAKTELLIQNEEFSKLINARNIVKQTPLLVSVLPLKNLNIYAATTPTLLHKEIRKRLGYAQKLLGNKADPNAQDLWGNTALHYLVYNCLHIASSKKLENIEKEYFKIIELLVKYGARTDIKNEGGKAALELVPMHSFLVEKLEKLFKSTS